ncbi:type II secretion system protein, partial [mine drainage metagenome]
MIAMLGKKENRKVTVDGKEIELQPKPKKLGLFSKGRKSSNAKHTAAPASEYSKQLIKEVERETSDKDLVKPTKMKLYIEKLGSKQKGLEVALRQQGIKESLYDFVKRMLIASIMLAAVLGITTIILMIHIGIAAPAAVFLGFAVGIVAFYVGLNTFLQFPKHKSKSNAKIIERDIIFAARDLIISLRSGMPLFNALTSVSTGYGEASKEFAKVVQKVQLGTPLVDA